MRLRSVFASIAILLLLPAAASAVPRYAAPAGAEIGTCASDAPCTFKRAVEIAADGDEVIVLPGEHTVSGVLQKPFVTVHIHGTATGASAPLITFTDGGWLALGTVESTVRDVRVEGSTNAVVSGIIERVYVHTPGGSACQAAQVLDSVCWSGAGRGVFVGAGDVLVRNVTAYGGAYGIQVQTSSAGKAGVSVTNTIARGGTKDVYAAGSTDSGSDLSAVVTLDHSNFVTTGVPDADGNTIQPGAGNQSGDPKLVSPAAGNFHQTAASPTHDAGVAAPGTDLDGDPRQLGAATDIGADESPVAPVGSSGAASEVTPTGATLHGSVATGGAATNAVFEYAASPLLGFTAGAVTLPGAAGPTPVSTRLEGLVPGTTYYFRVAATNGYGTGLGVVLSFTTPGVPGGGGGVDTEPPVLGSLALSAKRFRVGPGSTPVAAAAAVRGTVLSFRVSEAATATIAVQRGRAGRRKAGRCVAPSKAKPGARRCTRWTTRATLTRAAAAAGKVSVPFSGRVGNASLSKKLPPGRYRFRVVATDAAGNASDPATIRFRIVRR
jgi:hypothetical protein